MWSKKTRLPVLGLRPRTGSLVFLDYISISQLVYSRQRGDLLYSGIPLKLQMCAESNNAQYYRTISSREQYRTISSFTCRRLGTAVTWWLGGDHFNMPMRCSLQQNTLHQNEMHYTGFDAVTCDTKCNTVGRRSDPVVIRWRPLVSGIFSHNGGDELMRRPLTNPIFQFKT